MAHELGAAAAFPRLGLVARRKSREGGEARTACLAFPPLPWYTWVAPRGGREPLGLNRGHHLLTSRDLGCARRHRGSRVLARRGDQWRVASDCGRGVVVLMMGVVVALARRRRSWRRRACRGPPGAAAAELLVARRLLRVVVVGEAPWGLFVQP